MFHVELLVVGLIQGCMYAMMALGLTLVYGLLRILHVAHAGLFTLGAYVGVLATNAGLPIGAAALLAVAAAAAAGPLLYHVVYKPLLDKPPHVALIASIGVLIAMTDGFRLLFGPYGIPFENNPWFVTGWSFGGVFLNAVPVLLLSIPAPVPAIAAGAFLAGAGGQIFGVLWYTTLHTHVAPSALSRVSAYDILGSIALVPLGEAAAGPLIESLGIAPTLWLAAALIVLPTAAVLAVPEVRTLRTRVAVLPTPGTGA